MIKFPLTKLLDEQAYYEWLLKSLHPKGLYCPNGHALHRFALKPRTKKFVESVALQRF